jgi:quercetin dioxygenase-like cupin family protein
MAITSHFIDRVCKKLVSIECLVHPNTGRPPHIHRKEDEMFYVLEGELKYLLDCKIGIARAGSSFYVSPGVVHAWRNDSPALARVLVITKNEKLERHFENWRAAFPSGIPDAAFIRSIRDEFDVELYSEPKEFTDRIEKAQLHCPTPASLDKSILTDANRQPASLSVLGVTVEILLHGNDTYGTQSIYQLAFPPQVQLPFYFYRDGRESFYVTSGELELILEGVSRQLRVGDFISIPAGTPYGFRNISRAACYVVGQSVPSGPEQFFQTIDSLTRTGQLTGSKVASALQDYGIQIIRSFGHRISLYRTLDEEKSPNEDHRIEMLGTGPRE